ncbi:MAG: hypothetical protein HKN49_05625 [Gammaproteobacteria bacterium]|nr:hypothetical protein [Gammaproteobacteria bacterium]
MTTSPSTDWADNSIAAGLGHHAVMGQRLLQQRRSFLRPTLGQANPAQSLQQLRVRRVLHETALQHVRRIIEHFPAH